MGVKGCWTCRERKVKCDLKWPGCGNCAKARRLCQGYGVQLSWPRDGDKKRAMVMREAYQKTTSDQANKKKFLNVSSWDVSLASVLESRTVPAGHLRTMKVPRPTYLAPTIINSEDSHLLGFFNESRSLILGPTDEEPLAQFILRVAFSNSSDAENPVLQGVLALSSLQLHGTSKSFRYKYLTLSSVMKDSTDWLDEKGLLQNLMAMMLLYHYELSLESNDKGSWVSFICAVKRIINTSPAVQKLAREEYSVFLDWIYYHEALAEFTVRHWQRPYEGCGYAPIVRSPRAVERSVQTTDGMIGCPVDVLQLVVHTCRGAIVGQSGETSLVDSESEYIEGLEQNISQAVGEYGPLRETSMTSVDRHALISDLHRLACLMYVNRGVHRVSGTEFSHRRLVREGILLLTKMGSCQNAWPLFIVACEAVDDDQRIAILDVFERSRQDRRRRSSHIHFIQYMVEAVWKQRDLDVENQVDYLSTIDAVIGAVPFMPLFA